MRPSLRLILLEGLFAFLPALFFSLPSLPAAQNPSSPPRLPEGLEPLVRSYPAPVQSALKALKQGAEDCESGQYAAALSSLPDLSTTSPTAIGDFAQLYRARSYLALERFEEALNHFRLLQSRFPDSSQLSAAIVGEARALLALRMPDQALAALQNPKLAESTESFYLRARAHEGAGDRLEALDLYLRLYSEHPASRQSSLALERLQALSPRSVSPQGNYKALLRRAENLVRSNRSGAARALLLKLPRTAAPDAAAFEQRSLLLAEAEYNLGRTATALGHLKYVTGSNPSRHAPALYLQGACHRRLADEAAFLSARDTAVRLYPRSPQTERLLYSVATYFDVDHRLEQARAAYALLLEKFPEGQHAQRARWKLAIIAWARRQPGEALTGFWSCLVKHPEPGNAAAALYWLGRCYEKLGDHRRALYLYGRARALAGDSYYGQRAGEAESAASRAAQGRLYNGIDFEQVTRLAESIALPSFALPTPAEPARKSIERARQLATAGLLDLALVELEWAAARYPGEKAVSFVSSRVYEMKEDFLGVIVTLRRAFPNYDYYPPAALPEALWRLFYPVRHWKLIVAQAEKYGADPALVLALIRQESAFNEEARSAADARGLMQVLPGTGRQLARQAGIARYTSRKLYHPETNIALGIRHLAALVGLYGGRLETSLAAYNAGKQRVERWLSDFGDVDSAEFLERVPFGETRGYIRRVLTNLAHYRRLTAAPR